jgi:hypothetical protein
MHFEIEFTGHENITSLHPKTIEITKDSHLTTNGDCIIGINASCGCKDLPKELKTKLRDPDSHIRLSIKVGDYFFEILGRGHKGLRLSHQNDIVLRTSSYVCPRTVATNCNEAANSIPRKIIRLLQNPNMKGILSIDVI